MGDGAYQRGGNQALALLKKYSIFKFYFPNNKELVLNWEIFSATETRSA